MEKFVLIGMRGPRNFKEQLDWYQKRGSHVYTYKDIKERGINAVIQEAVKIAYKGTENVLLNIDFDVLDLSVAPGLDEPLGIMMEDLLTVTLRIGEKGFAAFNIEWIPKPTAALYHIVTWTTLYLLAGLAMGRRKLR
jgi:arginase family enzyme